MSEEPLQLSLFNQLTENQQDFFIRKRPWSAAKHRILLKYIQAHCYNLGGDQAFQSKHINYVDGFAGVGKYDEGIGIEDFVDNSNFWKRYKSDFLDTDGSPLISLKCAKIFKLENRVNLRCFFAEEKKKNHKLLTDNCSLIGQDVEYKIYEPQKFALVLPEIMNELQTYPTIFFLDAFGVKGVTFEQICCIADYVRKYKGELFLLFHNRAVARSAGLYKTEYKNDREKRTAETYTQHLNKLLGLGSDSDWKPKWFELKEEEQEFERWALQYFKTRLYQESNFRGVASFEIKETYNDTRPQYSIVVGSNHPRKAFGAFLNEFVGDENKRLFYEVDKAGRNQNFLDKEWKRQNEERIFKLQPRIIEILKIRNKDWMVFDDVITLLILEVGELGYLKITQYRQIILQFYENKIIQAKNLGRRGQLTLKNEIKVIQ